MRNLPILRRDTAALTSTVSAMDLLLAVISYVFVQSHLTIRIPMHFHRAQTNPTVKAAKEGAFKGSVEWLIKYL
jgi:hypothetical protein